MLEKIKSKKIIAVVFVFLAIASMALISPTLSDTGKTANVILAQITEETNTETKQNILTNETLSTKETHNKISDEKNIEATEPNTTEITTENTPTSLEDSVTKSNTTEKKEVPYSVDSQVFD